jgi:hypothetical protein
MRVAAFDLGIRNLAFCVVDVSGSDFSIQTWDNYDLIAGSDSQTASRCECGGPPSWTDKTNKIICKRCAKKNKLACLPITTINVNTLKKLAKQEQWSGFSTQSKKEDYINEAKNRYVMPYVKQKGAGRGQIDLAQILTAVNLFLDSRLALFSECTFIRIENQPVFDNPTMKSVQIILYTLLTHRLLKEHGWNGLVQFVHASKKTEEEKIAVETAGGDYKARKHIAEMMVLKKLPPGKWCDFFCSRKKRSDLADAFLMCLR